MYLPMLYGCFVRIQFRVVGIFFAKTQEKCTKKNSDDDNSNKKMQLFAIQHFISSAKARAILIWQLLTVSMLKQFHLFFSLFLAHTLILYLLGL